MNMSNFNICGECRRDFKINRNGICVAFYHLNVVDEKENHVRDYLALHMADEWICPGCQTTMLVTNTVAWKYPSRDNDHELNAALAEYRTKNKLVEVLIR